MARGSSFHDFDEAKLQLAEEMLSSGNCTKKSICDLLGVSNNKTMERLIADYVEHRDRTKRLRAEKRKTAVSKSEVINWIESYLEGESMSDISNRFHRSQAVIKHHIDKHGALLRQSNKIDPLNPPLLPDECMADSFEDGQYVWSAKYGCVAQVIKQYKNAYRILVLSEGVQEYAYQAPEELGSLKHLEELGVNLSRFTSYTRTEEVKRLLYEAVSAANKRKDKK